MARSVERLIRQYADIRVAMAGEGGACLELDSGHLARGS